MLILKFRFDAYESSTTDLDDMRSIESQGIGLRIEDVDPKNIELFKSRVDDATRILATKTKERLEVLVNELAAKDV